MNNEIKEMNFSEMLFNRDERLLDYITNLQEENKRLKEIINDDMTTYLKGLEDGKDKMKECYDSVYKSRNEKAIEYVERVCESEKNINPYILHAPTLLNILNGGDEE